MVTETKSPAFQEIWFNSLYRYDWAAAKYKVDAELMDILRKRNNVHVMVVNSNSQSSLYSMFLKDNQKEITIIHKSPLACNVNYGNTPRNFVVVWEFNQCESIKETNATPPVRAAGNREEIPKATTSSPSPMGVATASPVVITKVDPVQWEMQHLGASY